MNLPLIEKRHRQWLDGKPVHPRERIKCGCCGFSADREFDYGFFCESCFLKAKTCATVGCFNPVQRERIHAVAEECSRYCRTCMFDYDPEPTTFYNSPMAEAQVWAPGGGHRSMGILKDLDRAIKKHGIKGRDPRKNWFYPPAEKEEL